MIYHFLLLFSSTNQIILFFNSLIKHFSKKEITLFIEEWKQYDTEYNGFLPEKTVSKIIINVLSFYLSKIDPFQTF